MEQAIEFRRPANWPRIVLCAWLLTLAIIAGRVAWQGDEKHSVYPAYAKAAQHWLAGADLYTEDNLSFRYSPLFASGFVPLAALPPRVGSVLWRLLNAAVYLGGFWWWMRRALPRDFNAEWRAKLFLIALPLAAVSLNNGQANPLMTGLLLAAFAAAGASRWTLASIFLAAAFYLKLYPLAAALLLVVLYPRRMIWRLGIAIPATGAACFLLQTPGYVMRQFASWFAYLRNDLRLDLAPEAAYRDLRLLLNITGLAPSHLVYFLLQMLAAAAFAAACWRRRDAPRREALTLAYTWSACWILLFGPATESSTYILVAPVLAWQIAKLWSEPSPFWPRALIAAAAALLAFALIAGWFPHTTRMHALGLHPLAMLCLLAAIIPSSRAKPR